MKFSHIILFAVGVQAIALPKVILEGENGIIGKSTPILIHKQTN